MSCVTVVSSHHPVEQLPSVVVLLICRSSDNCFQWFNCYCRSGQFKSVMTCRCGYSSSRFEPFSFLTLPLPESHEQNLNIVVVLLPQKSPSHSETYAYDRNDESNLLEADGIHQNVTAILQNVTTNIQSVTSDFANRLSSLEIISRTRHSECSNISRLILVVRIG
jgi:hypothetical protein